MWKKNSVILFTIALTLMSAFLGAGTYAYSMEKPLSNDFSSWDTNKQVEYCEDRCTLRLSGLNPGETVYSIIKIPNHDKQAIKVWIRLLNIICSENGVVEPEQDWYNLHDVKNDIDSVITFNLWVDRDGNAGGCDPTKGDEWIIEGKIDYHIDEIAGKFIPLGTMGSGETITVVTSYHMDEETENWAQSDKMTFDIELIREEPQINVCITLESRQVMCLNKNLGTITLQGHVWSLPSVASKITGTYSALYTPAPGYAFDHWETTGSISITSSISNPTTINVGGTGNLRAVYKVKDILTVTCPNSGETWIRGTTHTLSWKSTDNPGAKVKIELLKNGVVNRIIASNTVNDGSFSWAIPSTQTPGTDYKIRITSTTNPAISDWSNINFAITNSRR